MNTHGFLNAVSSAEHTQSANRACVITLNHTPQPQCLLLHEGSVQLRDALTGETLSLVCAPAIVGHEQQLMGQTLHVEAMTDIRYEIAPLDAFYQKMEHHSRWQELLSFMLHLPNRPSQQRAEKRASQDRSILSQLDSLMFNNVA